MILPGMDLIDRLRAHSAHERELLELAAAAVGAEVE